jgi:hypothetical protein
VDVAAERDAAAAHREAAVAPDRPVALLAGEVGVADVQAVVPRLRVPAERQACVPRRVPPSRGARTRAVGAPLGLRVGGPVGRGVAGCARAAVGREGASAARAGERRRGGG